MVDRSDDDVPGTAIEYTGVDCPSPSSCMVVGEQLQWCPGPLRRAVGRHELGGDAADYPDGQPPVTLRCGQLYEPLFLHGRRLPARGCHQRKPGGIVERHGLGPPVRPRTLGLARHPVPRRRRLLRSDLLRGGGPGRHGVRHGLLDGPHLGRDDVGLGDDPEPGHVERARGRPLRGFMRAERDVRRRGR